MKLKITGKYDYSQIINEFMKQKGISHILGFSGGADDKLEGVEIDDDLQKKHLQYQALLHERIIVDSLKPLQGYKVAVLTGGTKFGVPSTANAIARKLGFKTIGVTPKVGAHHSLPENEMDLQLIVEPIIGEGYWGDEGSVWTSMVDAIIVIGGGAGTLTECAHIMKINEAKIKQNQPAKFMIPIHGTGGLSEQLPHLWAKLKIRDLSMPKERVQTGGKAAELLLKTIEFEYNY